jgi:hypothetical protein
MTAVGCILVVGSLLWYQIGILGTAVIGTQNVDAFEDAAYMTLSLILVGLTMAALGATWFIQKFASHRVESYRFRGITRLSSVMTDRVSARIFVASAVSYGVLFGIVSSTLVFQPGIVFSYTYGVHVPSVVPVVCCGSLGQMPQLVIYMTQQMAILIVPENLILLFGVSWLVGLNAAIAYFAFATRSQFSGAKWIGGLGAVVGLFTVCPSCAGYFFLVALGSTGALALTLTLSSLQGVFIGAGIPILAITPVLTTTRMLDSKYCVIGREN